MEDIPSNPLAINKDTHLKDLATGATGATELDQDIVADTDPQPAMATGNHNTCSRHPLGDRVVVLVPVALQLWVLVAVF